MKRLLLLCIVAVLMCGTSYGWGGLAHATVAKIAEDHLTPKAKRLLDKYLDGKSIVYYASAKSGIHALNASRSRRSLWTILTSTWISVVSYWSLRPRDTKVLVFMIL